jgi:hypothetical protein
VSFVAVPAMFGGAISTALTLKSLILIVIVVTVVQRAQGQVKAYASICTERLSA